MNTIQSLQHGRVIILSGSSADQPHVGAICKALEEFGISYATRIASAHKSPTRLLALIDALSKEGIPTVFITVAGRSNALSGMTDAATSYPVIACPPPSEQWAEIDIWSSLRMPSGVAPCLVLDPANAALCAAKILALANPNLQEKIIQFQQRNAQKIEEDDRKLSTSWGVEK